VAEIVQSLKSFARIDEAQLKEACINEGLEATLKVVWNELKYKCQVHKNLGVVPPIRCYPGQLNQVFMNLLINAAQAIPVKGDITIETKTDGDHVVVRVSDTGGGIPPEIINRIFDPFFTSKEVGKGTGLGLSVSHGIVEKHGGTIAVESKVGTGTTFTIRLPIEGPPHE
jgi:two-component system NtrC family sensor kinase